MATEPEFKGDKKKPINSITGALEQRLIRSTIGWVPSWRKLSAFWGPPVAFSKTPL